MDNRLNLIEKALIESSLNLMPEAIAKPFREDLKCIRLVQRASLDKSVCIYYKRDRTPSTPWDDSPEGCRVAHVSMEVDGISGVLEADIWLVRGHIFEICFSQPMSRTSGHAKMLEHVMFSMDNGKFTASINKCDASDVTVKTGEAARELLLATLRVAIDERTSAAILTKYATTVDEGWKIYKLEDFRQVCADDANYIVLAERTNMSGLLAYKQHDTEGRLHLIDIIDDSVIRLPPGLAMQL